jgi:YihY family inner membrane protein
VVLAPRFPQALLPGPGPAAQGRLKVAEPHGRYRGDETVSRTSRRVQQRHPILAFPAAVARKFADDRAGSLAALIAYYGFFSLFPLLLVLVSVAGFLLHRDAALRTTLVDSALAQIPVIGSELRHDLGSIQGSAFAVAVGLLAALWSGMAVVIATESAMDQIWDVPRLRRSSFFRGRIRALAMLAVLGTSAAVGALVAGFGVTVGNGVVVWGGAILLSLLLNTVVFAAAFKLLTSERLSWSDVIPGSVLAGVSWSILQAAGGYLVDRQVRGASDVYGMFAVVIGLLTWIYIGAQVTLVAAEVNVVRRRRLWPRSLLPPPRRPQDRTALRTEAEEHEADPAGEIDARFRDERHHRVPGPGPG